MNIERYLFESPSPNPVQIGRKDPSVKSQESSANLPQNEISQKAQSFAATQTSEVKPTVESNQLLDVYA